MKNIRRASERGRTKTSWLDGRHSFSFGEYYDPAHMGFGPLRVINEDVVAPGGGFPTHGHRDMEIITYVLSGKLAHKDSLGSGSDITPGEVQLMRAGKGILHSEFNASDAEPVHLLQIWIMPEENGLTPAYQQKRFDPAGLKDRLRLIVSPDGADESLSIRQDARVFAGRLAANGNVSFPTDAARKYWVQVARGKVATDGAELGAGDAVAIQDEGGSTTVTAREDAEILVFDLPA